jgi:hypothetical protein
MSSESSCPLRGRNFRRDFLQMSKLQIQARSAWVACKKGPRPGGTVEVIVRPTKSGPMIQPLLIEWLQSSRWDEDIFLMIPGTSCLATIMLSLRNKGHQPIEAPHYPSAYALNSGLESRSPLRGINHPKRPSPYFHSLRLKTNPAPKAMNTALVGFC